MDIPDVSTGPGKPSPEQSPKPSTPATPVVDDGSGKRSITLILATWSAAVGVILAIISFILYVYYYERWMNLGDSMDTLRRLLDILRISNYCGSFGWIAVILAVALTLKEFIAIGFKSSVSALKTVDTKSAFTMIIIVLVFLLVGAAALIVNYELSEHLNDDTSEVVSRMFLYTTDLAVIAESVLVLTVVDSLRRAPATPSASRRQ